jgi:sugar lactone lactonase YvrE
MGAVTCVAPVGDRFGERVVWSAEERAMYWTDVVRFLVHRYDVALDDRDLALAARLLAGVVPSVCAACTLSVAMKVVAGASGGSRSTATTGMPACLAARTGTPAAVAPAGM